MVVDRINVLVIKPGKSSFLARLDEMLTAETEGRARIRRDDEGNFVRSQGRCSICYELEFEQRDYPDVVEILVEYDFDILEERIDEKVSAS